MTSLANNKFQLPTKYEISRPNVWLEMEALENEYNPVNLGVGYPDFAPPQYVVESLAEVAKSDDLSMHQYAKGFGHPRLVNILCKLYSGLINRNIAENEVLITVGAQKALHTAFHAFFNAGDEVIVVEPYFEAYEAMIKETGAISKFIPLRPKSDETQSTEDFYLDKDELESMFNKKTKAIVMNTPNNPLGKVFNMEEMEMISCLCKQWNVLCIVDEVYEWLVYGENKHIRMASLPGMWERTITIGSAGKSFSVTGWRTGWVYAPVNLMKNMRVVHVNCIYNHLTPIQEAIAMAFEKEYDNMMNNPKECYFFNLIKELEVKKEFILKAFCDAGIKTIRPQGGYMLIADVTSLAKVVDLSQEIDKSNSFRMTKWMVKRGLMGLPASAFYSQEHAHLAENYIRFCFIKEDETLKKAAEVLKTIK